MGALVAALSAILSPRWAAGAIVVSFTSPSNGATLQGAVSVSAQAHDSSVGTANGAGIAQVFFELRQGSTVILNHQELTASYDWDLTVYGVATGDYTLRAMATANSGGSNWVDISVHIIGDPLPPVNWVLTFSDEFNGTGAPDPAKWDRPQYDRRPNATGPDGWWDQADSYLENGNLVIRVRRVPDRNGDGDPYDYSSGAVQTLGHFTQTYGKFEMRAQLPTQPGWWVAFWMMQGNQGSIGNGGVDGSEVDTMEAWGWTDKINHAIHWDGYAANQQSVGTHESPAGIRDGFHIYTLEWFPDKYVFFIDGQEVWRTIGGGVCNQPGYLLITGEISTESWATANSWAMDPENAVYPDYFLVDWVHVYKDASTSPSLSIEAENMALINYQVNANSAASGGNLIKLNASGLTGSATTNFSGTTGSYDVKVWYFDENDGASTFRLYIGGSLVDEWVANLDLGSADPVTATRVSRILNGISITNGAEIRLEAVQNNQEWGRFDSIEFTPIIGPPAPARILGIDFSGNDVHLRFTTLGGHPYHLERAESLSAPLWNTVVPNIAGTGDTVTVTNVGGVSSPAGFYRVIDDTGSGGN
jgi:beta-glucanase (GH16 family)